MPTDNVSHHKVVSHSDWLEARRKLLIKEKELTRLKDEESKLRRELPWVKVEKDYDFDSPEGKVRLSDLFEGRSQLIVYHFMLGPGWGEGCSGCSFLADHFDGPNLHLKHHDVTLLCVSRAPLNEILAFKDRMGWKFRWVSSAKSDFNYDFYASSSKASLESGQIMYNFEMTDSSEMGEEHHGISVFYKDEEGSLYHTYSSYSRGVDMLCGTHNLLDLTPKGRNEKGTMDWVRLHDEYEVSDI